jgi:C4-dicarboxylate-specific signal transduction histidine kinase
MKTNKTSSIQSMREEATTPFRKPDLPLFRRLQVLAIIAALCWVFTGAVIGYHLVGRFTAVELERQQSAVQQQANILARLVYKELRAADKLAVALSQDSAIIEHLQEVNRLPDKFSSMSAVDRKSLLEASISTQSANTLITNLLRDVDMMSLFILDAAGNCVATGYTVVNGENLAVGCLGGNYRTRSYYSQARENGAGHQFAVGRRVPLPSLFFSRATNIDDRFIGAAVVRVDTQELLSELPLSTIKTWITDRNGIVISSSYDSGLKQQLGAELYPKISNEVLEQTYDLPPIKRTPLLSCYSLLKFHRRHVIERRV